MPFRFGPVSLEVHSALNHGKLTGDVTLSPGIRHKAVLLFLRLPDGYHASTAILENGNALRMSKRDGDDIVFFSARVGVMRFSVAVRK